MSERKAERMRKGKAKPKTRTARRIARLKASAHVRDESPGLKDSVAELELYRPRKTSVTLRLDRDVLAWFRKPGPGYQTRINHALRQVITEEKWKKRKAGW